jgi:hypothetical protein
LLKEGHNFRGEKCLAGMAAPPGDRGDPERVWVVLRNVFKNLLPAPAAQQTKYLASLQQMVAAFPQALVATDDWPGVAARREAVTLALLRRLLQCQAAPAAPSALPACLALETLVLFTLMQHDPARWTIVLTDLIGLWHRLAVTSDLLSDAPTEDGEKHEGLTVSESSVAVRLLSAPQPEDADFPADMNFLVLSCPAAVEALQDRLTCLLEPLLPALARYCPLALARVQGVCLRQLELGEAGLKATTLQLLTALHSAAGAGPLRLWGEEAMWLGELVKLLAGPADLGPDREELQAALAWLAKGLIRRWRGEEAEQEEEEMAEERVVLAAHLLGPWLEVVRAEGTGCLGPAEDALEQLMAAVLTCPAVQRAADCDAALEVLLGQHRLELHLVAAQLAWRELRGSGVLEEGRAGKRRAEGEPAAGRSLARASPSWARLTGLYEGRLDSLPVLVTFAAVVRSLLTRLAAGGHGGELEVVERGLLARATAGLAKLLGAETAGPGVETLLDCLETLVLCGHLWPGSAHSHSEIADLQQSWAGLLSLPWRGARPTEDLRPQPEVAASGSAAKVWPEACQAQALLLLLQLPREVCPRWRVAVCRAAWAARSPSLLPALPWLPGLGSTAASLAQEVAAGAVGGPGAAGLAPLLAAAAPRFLCSLARSVAPRLVVVAGRAVLLPTCSTCSPRPPGPAGSRTPSKVVLWSNSGCI